MTLTIQIDGAEPDAIIRGLLAAEDVFSRAGVTAARAAEARFAVEGWDIGGFTGEISDDDLEICDLWDRADQAAVRACCAGWPADRVPETANLEVLFKEDRRTSRDATCFEDAEVDIIDEMYDAGYFREGGDEDRLVFHLLGWRADQLTAEERRLYDERIVPLMRVWFFERDRFDAAYRLCRAA